MVIATMKLCLTTMGMKGAAMGPHTLAGGNGGVLCRRSSSVTWLRSPPASRSRFSVCAFIQRDNSSLSRRRDSDAGFTGAVCTLGTHYPTKGNWGCKAKPAALSLTTAINVIYFLVLVGMILWKKCRAKQIKSLLALLLLSICIGLAIFAVKGNAMAVSVVSLFNKAGKIYKVLGHFLSIFGGPL